jgi:protein PhnA
MSESFEVKDANGNLLADGDSIQLTQNLPKESSLSLKQGTVGKKVRLIPGNTEAVECRFDGISGAVVIKTCFIKKRK